MSSWLIENAIRDLLGATNKLHEAVEALQETIFESRQTPHTVTVKDMSVASGLSVSTVHKAIQEGKLPGTRIGSKYVIPDLEFEAWRRGKWTPRQEPVQPARKLVHRRNSAED